MCYCIILSVITELSSHFLLSFGDGHNDLSTGWWMVGSLFLTHKVTHIILWEGRRKPKEMLKSACWKPFMCWAWVIGFSWLGGSRDAKLSLVGARSLGYVSVALRMHGTASVQTVSMSRYGCEKPQWNSWGKPACIWIKSLYNCVSQDSSSMRYSGIFTEGGKRVVRIAICYPT